MAARILFIKTKCPLCGRVVINDPKSFEPLKHPEDHQNIEWVQTKRGLKQYFHTDCWNAMILAQQIEAKDVKNNVVSR